jgi:hypothetical protein
MFELLDRAFSEGEVIIPTDNPRGMAFEFQKLRGTLRALNRAEQVDMVSFHIDKPGKQFIIRCKATSPLTKEMEAVFSPPALPVSSQGENPPSLPPAALPVDDIDASLARILGKHNA